ncbi:fimbrial protein [Citrobacter amalonaticus]|uniref:fimbrial protein n=1 Tax=Citrobacter amalonaticus TaxID=35703 RepID=UPI001905F242|nr:fimbrial protein [Citrobacter amalonaticus]MBJ9256972.1 hypothetical protein [Citrobacter amalonaticus]HAU5634537.1 hypothetical protein [Citrobacter amalonaticus]HDQ2809991.1 hypothetical protein [Citrobacter amalonaticus]
MRLKSVNVAAFIMSAFTSPLVVSSVSMTDVTWVGGDHPGQIAARCIATYPSIMPLTIPRTFVADSSFEVGDVIYSWDYADFMPNYLQTQCIPEVDSNNSNHSMHGSYIMLTLNQGRMASNGILTTALDGVGIRLFYKVNTTTDGTNGYLAIHDNGASYINRPVEERPLFDNHPNTYLEIRCDAAMSSSSNRYTYGCDYSLSIRAELVKTGDITVGSLTLPELDEYLLIKWNSGYFEGQRNSFSGNAVTLIAPACQLKNANHSVAMGDMVPLSATPRRGTNVPVNLDLECSGQVNNVNFRFEDAGTSPSSGLEKNVSLYSSEGIPVEGLEIEMRYEGERVNIDGTTEISTGSHGQRKTVADALPLFDSESTANFTANYVQLGPVISGGNGFTGAINGKVNMWVTYN